MRLCLANLKYPEFVACHGKLAQQHHQIDCFGIVFHKFIIFYLFIDVISNYIYVSGRGFHTFSVQNNIQIFYINRC